MSGAADRASALGRVELRDRLAPIRETAEGPPEDGAAGAPEVVWLASYPKSGNTWLRFLIAHLLGGPVASSAEVQARLPDAHRLRDWAELAPGRVHFVKAHWRHEHLPAQVATRGFVHIVRNPWDVIASNARFNLLCADRATLARPAAELAALRDAYVATFLCHGGDPRWIRHGFGTWRQHLRSWRAAAGSVPSLFLRYEDLHAEPQRHAVRVAAFLGLARSEDEIAAAVAGASFDAMRRLEEREIGARREGLFWGDHRDRARLAGRRFIARGGSGFGRDEFTPAQWHAIQTAFAAEIALAGYADTTPPAAAAAPRCA